MYASDRVGRRLTGDALGMTMMPSRDLSSLLLPLTGLEVGAFREYRSMTVVPWRTNTSAYRLLGDSQFSLLLNHEHTHRGPAGTVSNANYLCCNNIAHVYGLTLGWDDSRHVRAAGRTDSQPGVESQSAEPAQWLPAARTIRQWSCGGGEF